MRTITPEQMQALTVKVYEPFAEFLGAMEDEVHFELSLLDVVRFAGHACPSMVGAFLVSRKAVSELYPETQTLQRGDVRIELSRGPQDGPTGPIANVLSYIFGAWGASGFGGLGGEMFRRRNLLKFNSTKPPPGAIRFCRQSTGHAVDVYYEPAQAQFAPHGEKPFQVQWREKISHMVVHPNEVLRVEPVPFEGN